MKLSLRTIAVAGIIMSVGCTAFGCAAPQYRGDVAEFQARLTTSEARAAELTARTAVLEREVASLKQPALPALPETHEAREARLKQESLDAVAQGKSIQDNGAELWETIKKQGIAAVEAGQRAYSYAAEKFKDIKEMNK